MATIGTKGDRLDLLIRQGADFSFDLFFQELNGVPTDLTGMSFRAQIRRSPQSSTVAASFVFAVSIPEGKVTASIPASVTATIAAGDSEGDDASQYVWDMESVSASGFVSPCVYGNVSVFREVTR